MKICKVCKAVAKVGAFFIHTFEKAVDFADHVIHRKEYERKAKRRKIIWTVVLSVAGGIVAVLLFPYRIIVKKNGDFEIRSLLIRIYRHTDDYAIPEGGSEEFEISAVDEDIDAIEA